MVDFHLVNFCMKLTFINAMPLSRQWALGTLLSSLPLLTAVAYAIWTIEQHNQKQQTLVDKAIVVNRQLVQLQDELKELERSARQFAVLRDNRVVVILREKLNILTDLSNSLLADVDSPELNQQILRLQDLLQEDLLLATNPDSQAAEYQLSQLFRETTAIRKRIVDISQQVISGHLQEQKESFSGSQFLLISLGLLALPSSIIFQLLWTSLISKPMNQLSQTIGLLGRGDLDQPIQLEGPQELKILAERLEWLRSNLKSIEAQKKRLLRHVTHELKTPLSAIFEASSLLQEQIAGPLNADQLKVVDILSENARRLQDMITQLLNFNSARLAAQEQMQRVDLKNLSNKIVGQYQRLIEARRISLALPSANIEVTTDPSLLDMVVSNLLNNALVYSAEDTEVRISWARTNDDWWVEIADEGPGIPEDEKERVFHPFYQGSVKRSGSTKGTGLGLAIVRECVNQLNGEIFCTDQQPRGTIMKVIFNQSSQANTAKQLVYS